MDKFVEKSVSPTGGQKVRRKPAESFEYRVLERRLDPRLTHKRTRCREFALAPLVKIRNTHTRTNDSYAAVRRDARSSQPAAAKYSENDDNNNLYND